MNQPVASPKEPKFAPGRIGYAVGDVHGRADLLALMLDRIEADAASGQGEGPPVLIFLGDYIDRGPDSRGVIDALLTPRLQAFEARFLIGNHEAAMAAFIADPERNRAWLMHGGMETLISYGVRPPPIGAGADKLRETVEAFKTALPEAHAGFFSSLDRLVFYGDYAFVHAGVDARKPYWKQSDEDLLWIRRKFLHSSDPFPYVVVHGHTPSPAPYRDHRRIGVDTGAYATGVLSAARFEGGQVDFLDVRRSLAGVRAERPAPPAE